MTTAKETTRDGFDCVMVDEGFGIVCSIYIKGGQVPLYRKTVKDEAAAERYFVTTLAERERSIGRMMSFIRETHPSKTGA